MTLPRKQQDIPGLGHQNAKREQNDGWQTGQSLVHGRLHRLTRRDLWQQIKQRFVRFAFEPNTDVTLAMAEGVEGGQGPLGRVSEHAQTFRLTSTGFSSDSNWLCVDC
jgi:hypothetical protein